MRSRLVRYFSVVLVVGSLVVVALGGPVGAQASGEWVLSEIRNGGP